jgi:hypothetical protein
VPLCLAILLAAGSCAGDGTKIPVLDDGMEPRPPFPPTLSAIHANVFSPTCAPGCHEAGGIAPFSVKTPAEAYASLVNVPNGEGAVDSRGRVFLRVEPGAPSRSYIILKLKGSSQILGDRMPLGQPPLDRGTIDAIAEWIANGAPDD